MKQILGLTSTLVLLISWSAASSNVKVHSCLPGTIGICVLDHVFYNRSHATTYVFPRNQTYFRIGSDMWSKGIDSVIEDFDIDLYRALGEPHSLEIVNVEMKTLVIPRELVVGNFADNRLSNFSIEVGTAEPKLTYLDLGRNSISDLTNITGFVNLESLYLFSNDLKSLETSLFQNLTKLRYLNLHYNSIERIVGNQLPQSLTYLGLYYNNLKSLDFSSLQSKSLQILNIERNELELIPVSAMKLAMPNLQLVRFGGNRISQETMLAIIDNLKRNNISYRDEGDEVSCYYDEELVEGVCMNRQMMDNGWIKATLLSLLTVVVAIVFVLLARWIFLAMNK